MIFGLLVESWFDWYKIYSFLQKSTAEPPPGWPEKTTGSTVCNYLGFCPPGSTFVLACVFGWSWFHWSCHVTFEWWCVWWLCKWNASFHLSDVAAMCLLIVRLPVHLVGSHLFDHACVCLTCWACLPLCKWNCAFKHLNLVRLIALRAWSDGCKLILSLFKH